VCHVFARVVITGLDRRWVGERTVASIDADDEAGLLLDFLRHFGGRGVVDGDGFRQSKVCIAVARLSPGVCVLAPALTKRT
jgi:hypothetical protein